MFNKGGNDLTEIWKQGTVIYFAPVQKQYFQKWEYYQVDLDMLNACFSNVIVCHSNWSFIKTIIFSRVSAVYGWWWHQAVIPVILARILKVPVYITGAVHMYDESGSPDFFSKGILFRLACRISWRLSSKNFFISESQYRQVCSHEVVKNACVLRSSLSESFDIEKLKFSLARKNSSSRIKMLTIVWMTKDQLKRKSVYETLEAIKRLVKDGRKNFVWTIAGGSADGTKGLAYAIENLGLADYIKLQVDLSNEQKIELYNTSDLYIQPSYYEGFGNAVLEAMSYGLVPIVSRNTAQPEVIGDSGFIVEEINSEFIAKAIGEYLNLSSKQYSERRELVYKTISERHLFDYRLDQFSKMISKEEL